MQTIRQVSDTDPVMWYCKACITCVPNWYLTKALHSLWYLAMVRKA